MNGINRMIKILRNGYRRVSSRAAVRAVLRLLPTLAAFVVLTSCASEEEPVFEPISASDIGGERVWSRITEESDYENYSFWPGHEGEQSGQAPHGPFHRIYVNRTLAQALPAEDKTAPDGSIIVKENLNASRELASLTVMTKVEGFNPDAGDWFWAKYQPDGSIDAEGAVTGCISCHAGMSQNDYIIVHPLDAQPETGEQ